MSSLRKLTPFFRLLFASLVLAIVLVLLYKGASGPMSAQQSPPSQQERQLENTIPKHVPISVKITKEKEKAWKDLKNENWARDFELEVTNTGDKPIYAVGISVYFDVQNEYQDDLRADFLYGRREMNNVRTKATAEDVPITPGGTTVFRLTRNEIFSWDKGRREKGYRLPTKATVKLVLVSFGDGTGLLYDQGVPYPKRPPEEI